MRIWYNNVVDTDRRLMEVDGDRVRVGRGTQNDLILPSPYIADEALVLYRRSAEWEIVVLGSNGIKIGDQRLTTGERLRISHRATIELFPFSLSLDLPSQAEVSIEAARKKLDQELSKTLADIHRELLEKMDLRRDVDPAQKNDAAYQLKLERHVEQIAENHPSFNSKNAAFLDHLAGCSLRNSLLRPDFASDKGNNTIAEEKTGWSEIVTAVPERDRELQSTATYIAKEIDLQTDDTGRSRMAMIDRDFWNAWLEIQDKVHLEFKKYLALLLVKKEIKDIVFGYGPLEDLLRLPSISEIMVVDRDKIYIESAGVIEESGRRFVSDEIVESIIQRIVGKVGRRIDKSQPLVDARLQDGSRVNAVIAPLAVSGPTLTIRKFPDRKVLIHDLVAMGSLTQETSEFLRSLVLSRKNIIVSGGTGTGKTTLLNCLSDFIPDHERIVTVEDTAELQLAKEHVVKMETKGANVEGAGEYTISDLVRNALRMRPDRVVVGECRGREALDMLQAMNTGHDGSLTTIHANSAQDVGTRLEVLVQMAADLPVSSIRQQVASAIDVIIQLKRVRDGRRIVSQITELLRVSPIDGSLEMRDLFIADEDGMLRATGQLPSFISDLLDSGQLQLETFYSSEATNALFA